MLHRVMQNYRQTVFTRQKLRPEPANGYRRVAACDGRIGPSRFYRLFSPVGAMMVQLLKRGCDRAGFKDFRLPVVTRHGQVAIHVHRGMPVKITCGSRPVEHYPDGAFIQSSVNRFRSAQWVLWR